MSSWFIDSWFPKDGFAFYSCRSKLQYDNSRPVIEGWENTYYIKAPYWQPLPSQLATAFRAQRHGFQTGFYEQGNEIEFDNPIDIIQVVREAYLSGGPDMTPPFDGFEPKPRDWPHEPPRRFVNRLLDDDEKAEHELNIYMSRYFDDIINSYNAYLTEPVLKYAERRYIARKLRRIPAPLPFVIKDKQLSVLDTLDYFLSCRMFSAYLNKDPGLIASIVYCASQILFKGETIEYYNAAENKDEVTSLVVNYLMKNIAKTSIRTPQGNALAEYILGVDKMQELDMFA